MIGYVSHIFSTSLGEVQDMTLYEIYIWYNEANGLMKAMYPKDS